MGGWIGLNAVLLLGTRIGRYRKDGSGRHTMSAHPPSSIPFLALGARLLAEAWCGFNVMSAQMIDKISGLVAVNSLMAMVSGTLVAVLLGKNDPGFAYNGPLAGLVAVRAGSDVMHPAGAPGFGGVAGAIFVTMFTLTQNGGKIDDVLGLWALVVGLMVCGVLKAVMGLRLSAEEEHEGAGPSIHKIGATPERGVSW